MKPLKIPVLELSIIPISKLLPEEEVPAEFYKVSNTFNKFVSTWFYAGTKSDNLRSKEGIDRTAALAHLKAILISWDLLHEKKIAVVAYLLSEWFDITDKGSNITPKKSKKVMKKKNKKPAERTCRY